jgi:ferredoxin
VSHRRLRVNPITCDGYGMCAELLPELIVLDDWGYPMVYEGSVPDDLVELAKRAVRICPTVALLLEEMPEVAARRLAAPRRRDSSRP